MKMNVRDAIAYACKGDGIDFNRETYDKLISYFYKLPHNPKETTFLNFGREFIIKDYSEGWFAVVAVWVEDEKIRVKLCDGDMMDKDDNRAKSNKEALEIMAKFDDIKWASDIDEYWNMSDDHKYWSRMNDINRKAHWESDRLYSKL